MKYRSEAAFPATVDAYHFAASTGRMPKTAAMYQPSKTTHAKCLEVLTNYEHAERPH